jgi:O-antigen/teichoic acid export membrane protein
MSNEFTNRLLNIALRSLSTGAKLVLIFGIVKLLKPTEVGLFGLMLATVTFSVLVIGADYYAYAQRELLARPSEHWSFVIQHQIKAQLILYIVLLPAQLLIFVSGLMAWEYVAWFFALLVLEHIAQEINRILVVMHKQLMASWVIFIRMGSWVFVVLPLMVFNEQYRNLETLYMAWLVGCSLAIAIGILAIKRALPNWEKVEINYTWLKKGFKVGGLFLLATLCFRGLLTFDRYAVEILDSIEILGVYVFYIGIVMGAYGFLEPAVFSFLYPRMLQTYQMKEKEKYQKVLKELTITTLVISLSLAVLIWFIAPFLIYWIDKPIYSIHVNELVWLIAAGFIHAVGYIPHYALYAMKGDKWIISAHISSIMIFFLSLVLIPVENGIQAAVSALLFAFIWMLLIKTIGYGYTKKHSTLLNT